MPRRSWGPCALCGLLTGLVALSPVGGRGQALDEDVGEPARALAVGDTSLGGRLAQTFVDVRRHELPNGVHVVLDPHGETALVTVAVSISAGSRDQGHGWTGLAHLAEHLMFRSRASQPSHYIERIENLGAIEVNGVTERDRTVYFETVPSEALDQVLWFEAERFAQVLPELDAAAIANEREIVLRERAIREAQRRIGPSLVDRELYPVGHSYAEAALERTQDLAAIGLPEMRSFLQRAYAPSLMTIVVSGRFDPEHAHERVEALFGTLRASAPPIEPPGVNVPRLDAERRLLIDVPRATDQLSVLWPTPPYGTQDDAALDIAARLLAVDVQERLARLGLVVVVRQDSADVSSELSVVVEVPRRSGTRIPLDAVDAALRHRLAHPPRPDELERARLHMLETLASAASSRRERALMLSRRPPAFPDGVYDPRTDLARYDSLDPDAVHQAIRRWLPRDRRLLVSLNASARAPFEGRLVTRVVVR